MTLHWEVLDEERQAALRKIAAMLPPGRFVLAGGTGLALVEGHRNSEDVDFFTVSDKLRLPSMHAVVRGLKALGGFRLRAQDQGTLHADAGGAHCSWLATPYPFLRPPLRQGRLRIAHPVDIGLMKLAAIVSRGSKKDFIDLACVLERHLRLPKLLDLALTKYPEGHGFILNALRALVYFADADREDDPGALDPRFGWDRVKRLIETETRKALPAAMRRAEGRS